MILSFGKHRGRHVCQLPEDYLRWLMTIDLEPALSRAVRAEIRSRDQETTRPARSRASTEIVDQWYGHLARKYHPDRGGSHEAMKAITEGRDLMKTMLAALSA